MVHQPVYKDVPNIWLVKAVPLIWVIFVERIVMCVNGRKFSSSELVWSLYLSIYFGGFQIGMFAYDSYAE